MSTQFNLNRHRHGASGQGQSTTALGHVAWVLLGVIRSVCVSQFATREDDRRCFAAAGSAIFALSVGAIQSGLLWVLANGLVGMVLLVPEVSSVGGMALQSAPWLVIVAMLGVAHLAWGASEDAAGSPRIFSFLVLPLVLASPRRLIGRFIRPAFRPPSVQL